MKGTKYATREAILERASAIMGIPFRDIDTSGRLATGKGAIGTVIEESWFGYSPNSEAEPDFPEAGIELKVTPYLRDKKTKEVRAKERLVCNIINYMEEYKRTFETSSFWQKCNTMLLMFYEHIAGISKGDFSIAAAVLFSFPQEDLIIIEHDWEIIINKVRRGQAHEISEGDTMYLAACTKGANSSCTRPQPCSDIPAKQRAYSLKSSYMTHVLRQYIFGQKSCPKIINCSNELKKESFEDYVLRKVEPYYGKTQQELSTMLGVDSKAKSLNEVLIARMLGVKGRINKTEEFQKAGIILKTIRVQHNGTIQESMSFPTFDFIALSKEDNWEESWLYNYLAPTKFMFVIFQENKQSQYVLNRIRFWNIPNSDLDEVRQVWERTVQVIREGVKLIPKGKRITNNLPKKSENRVAHVRPHGKDISDTLPLPDGRQMPKQCFWLNNNYIKSQIILLP